MTGIRKPNRRHVAALARFSSGEVCVATGKISFVDDRSAQLALSEIARIDPRGDQLRTYLCRSCHDFHIGHARP